MNKIPSISFSYVVKAANDEVAALVKDKEALDILFNTGLPSCSYWDFLFDETMSIRNSCIVIGSYNRYDIVMDMAKNGSIFISSADDLAPLFLNSSLGQFVAYLSAYIAFINKKHVAHSEVNKERYEEYECKRSEYVRELERYMIEKDERAYHHENYYWGSILEQHENGMFL